MSTHKYELELISLTNSPDTTKFRIRVVGTREYFIKNLQEIYIPEYLDADADMQHIHRQSTG